MSLCTNYKVTERSILPFVQFNNTVTYWQQQLEYIIINININIKRETINVKKENKT